eukprot:PhF_6_TR37187/c0_g1_i1/m.54792
MDPEKMSSMLALIFSCPIAIVYGFAALLYLMHQTKYIPRPGLYLATLWFVVVLFLIIAAFHTSYLSVTGLAGVISFGIAVDVPRSSVVCFVLALFLYTSLQAAKAQWPNTVTFSSYQYDGLQEFLLNFVFGVSIGLTPLVQVGCIIACCKHGLMLIETTNRKLVRALQHMKELELVDAKQQLNLGGGAFGAEQSLIEVCKQLQYMKSFMPEQLHDEMGRRKSDVKRRILDWSNGVTLPSTFDPPEDWRSVGLKPLEPLPPSAVSLETTRIAVLHVFVDDLDDSKKLQIYVNVVSSIIKRFHGRVQSYRAGSVVGYWSAFGSYGDPCKYAVKASIELSYALIQQWKLISHIGVDCSQCTIGTIGSSELMVFPELKGPAVEGAEALASLASEFGAAILLSHVVHSTTEQFPDIAYHARTVAILRSLSVRPGPLMFQMEGIRVVEVYGDGPPAPATQRAFRVFERGVESLCQGDTETAIDFFHKYEELMNDSSDKVMKSLLRRCGLQWDSLTADSEEEITPVGDLLRAVNQKGSKNVIKKY